MTKETLFERSSDGARTHQQSSSRDTQDIPVLRGSVMQEYGPFQHLAPELSQRPEGPAPKAAIDWSRAIRDCFPIGKSDRSGIEFQPSRQHTDCGTLDRSSDPVWDRSDAGVTVRCPTKNPSEHQNINREYDRLRWPGDKTAARSDRREIATDGAMINLPKDLDPSKPIHFVNYFNGWRSSHIDGYKTANVADTASHAPPNTVFISPRWQDTEHSENSSHRIYDARGGLSGSMQRIFQAVPELGRTRLDPRDTIGLVGYSAGFNAVGQALSDKSISPQVNDIVMLDSPSSAVQQYVMNNLPAFINGNKRFASVAGDWRTPDYQQFSRAVAAGVLKLGYNPQVHIARGNAEDYHPGGRQSFVFLYTHTPHSALPGKEYKHVAF
jgi:hypothetical protein